MKIFPHILTRVGGNSFETIIPFNKSDVIISSEKLVASVKEKDEQKKRLCTHLLEFIQQITDSKIQNTIQNLRRDLFNERNIKSELIVTARKLLSEELKNELDFYFQRLLQIESQKQEFEVQFRERLLFERGFLQKLASNQNFLKGLLLSSKSLYNEVHKYQNVHPYAFKNKELQNELSLLKYLTRMASKTSPFSTLSNIAIGKMSDQSDEVIEVFRENDGQEITSHIYLNNFLFRYLKGIFAASRGMYLYFNLRTNPTIEAKSDQFSYLTNANNIEAFQRIQITAVLSSIRNIVDAKRNGIQFYELITEICDLVEAEKSDIEVYVKQLIDYGFLEFDFGVSGIDPYWDMKLRTKLEPLANKVPHMEDLLRCLERLRSIAQEYSISDVKSRAYLLTTAFDTFRDVCIKLHKEAGLPEAEREAVHGFGSENPAKTRESKNDDKKEVIVDDEKDEQTKDKGSVGSNEPFRHFANTSFSFKPEQMFYEDTSRNITPLIRKKDLYLFIETLDGLLGELRIFNTAADERDKIAAFIGNSTESPISLLSLYENYSKEKRRSEENQRKDNINGFITEKPAEISTPVATNRQKLIEFWSEEYKNLITPTLTSQKQILELYYDHLKQTGIKVKMTPKKPPESTSFGTFVQFYTEPNENGGSILKGVINSTFSGYGKMLSRFLQILPPQVTDDVRKWNAALAKNGELLIEDCDASHFNANIHPPLLPYEIRIPGGNNSLPLEKQLPVSDFDVSIDGKGDLKLNHTKSGRRSYIFDLGFEAHAGRSHLFKLLHNFSGIEYLNPGPVTRIVNSAQRAGNDGASVIQYPRIIYENIIVIQRKSWLVPRALLPVRKPGESDAMFLASLNEWRQQHGIPCEVFVNVNPTRSNNQIDPQTKKILGRDEYKPQYINFNSPIMSTLLEKLMRKCPQSMKFEEMLPNSQQLIKINGEKFATEYLVQWYKYP